MEGGKSEEKEGEEVGKAAWVHTAKKNTRRKKDEV